MYCVTVDSIYSMLYQLIDTEKYIPNLDENIILHETKIPNNTLIANSIWEYC